MMSAIKENEIVVYAADKNLSILFQEFEEKIKEALQRENFSVSHCHAFGNLNNPQVSIDAFRHSDQKLLQGIAKAQGATDGFENALKYLRIKLAV
jgi:hypothetical protein